MQRFVSYFTLLAVALVALFPVVNLVLGSPVKALDGPPLVALNFLAWSVVLTFLIWRLEVKKSTSRLAERIGIHTKGLSLERMLSVILNEVNRKNKAISLNLLERRVTNEQELSRTLERIVNLSRQLLNADSAELALFDRESGMYHSSFVVGRPFRSSSQAMLSGAIEGTEINTSPDVLVQPIAFAGAVLGSLRVALKGGRIPTVGDRQVMNLLALQSGLAIVNSRYTEQLLKMKSASDETIKAKTGFLANLSHELRGPLGIIINAVELVLDGLCGPVSDEQSETLGMIRSNGEHLLELVNDVLDYAKIESGKVVPNKTEILINELLKDISGVVRKQAESKSHQLVVLPSDDVFAIECDKRHLRQMLINLLTNAIKYTPNGGRIELWAERIPGNKISLSVKDTGVGIDPADRDRVFNAFERVDNAYSLTQVGTGLGMPLTKKLAEVNGGSISFESVPQQGSRFWIVFPAIQVTSSLIHEKEEPPPPVKGNNDVILLVQKADTERQMITRFIEHLGFRVEPAASKLEALEVLRKEEVHIVVIDNNIVDSPDDDVVGQLRKEAKESSVPVVLISSRAFIFDIEKYLKAGIDRCLIKPIHLKELAQTCRELIDGSYSGSVIDQAELELARDTHTDGIKVQASKLLGVDDIFH